MDGSSWTQSWKAWLASELLWQGIPPRYLINCQSIRRAPLMCYQPCVQPFSSSHTDTPTWGQCWPASATLGQHRPHIEKQTSDLRIYTRKLESGQVNDWARCPVGITSSPTFHAGLLRPLHLPAKTHIINHTELQWPLLRRRNQAESQSQTRRQTSHTTGAAAGI